MDSFDYQTRVVCKSKLKPLQWIAYKLREISVAERREQSESNGLPRPVTSMQNRYTPVYLERNVDRGGTGAEKLFYDESLETDRWFSVHDILSGDGDS